MHFAVIFVMLPTVLLEPTSRVEWDAQLDLGKSYTNAHTPKASHRVLDWRKRARPRVLLDLFWRHPLTPLSPPQKAQRGVRY